ncbi:MAG: alpha/beta fold hydrolase [Candidatus Hermodarchaeota archaeon]
MKNIIFIHGLESSSKGFKAKYLKELIPEILTPDFEKFLPSIRLENLLKIRMSQLNSILKDRKIWVIIGSSFGGLMAVLYALQNPNNVKRLILLSPYLATNLVELSSYSPIKIPVIVFHGKKDEIARFQPSRDLAHRLFTNLKFYATEDDHDLNQTVQKLNWIDLIS